MPPSSPADRPRRPPPSQPNAGGRSWLPILLVGMLLGLTWLWKSNGESATHPRVDYSTFYAWAEAGKVKAVTLEGAEIRGELAAPEPFGSRKIAAFHTLAPPGDDALLPVLRAKNVRIQVAEAKEPVAVQLLVTLLPMALIMGAWFWMSRRARTMMAGGGPFAGLARGRTHKFEKSAAAPVTFADIAGLKAAKQDLQEIVQFLKEPERFQRLGGKAPRGVLLVGPPGTGKTLLARAVAGESGVPFYSITASEFVEMFVGLGAARVRELFQEAKKDAPSIVFIDEIDAVGRTRGAGLGASHDEREQTLNQLLAEMDGFDRRDLVVVLAATNRPDVLDPALLRPGRFDRRVVVDRPEVAARRSILEVHTKGKPLAADVDLQAIAANTPGFSGADLANLVNEAALHATRRSGEAIAAGDFSGAFDKIVLGDPRETKLDAREKRRVAVHEAGHALCAHLSSESEPLHRITIIPRGLTLGATQQTPSEDRHLATRPELAARLRVLMGGYAAEQLLLGAVSSGAEDDLRQATDIASRMVAHYGMSEKLGPVHFDYRTEHPFLGQRIATDGGTSQATLAAIEAEARRLLGTALGEATKLLSGCRTELESLITALLERETLERDELQRLLGPARGAGEPAAAPLALVGSA